MPYYDVFFNCMNRENAPKRKKGGWFDIPLPYDVAYEAGEVVKLVFDLRVKMPVGYEGIIQPRSSTLEKTGLISSGFGVIEDSYCGEDDYIGYRFYATKDGFISAGSCLVQMRFQKKMEDCSDFLVPDSYFTGVKSRGGFGSTDNEKTCGKSESYKQIKDAMKTDYELGFSHGFDEGHMDGYEEGFKAGYDKAIEDIKGSEIFKVVKKV